MRKVKLGNSEIAKVCAGQSAPQDANAFGDSGYAFIRAGSLEYLCDGGDTKNLEHINAEMAKKYRLKLFPKNTVTFAKSGMSAKIGRVYKLKDSAYIVSHLAAIIPQGNLDADYLVYFLKANPPANLIPNDAYPSIRLSEIENISINLPPISVQRRIAAILDKADAICRKRKECIKMLDELVKARFVEMFGDVNKNSHGFQSALGKDLFIFSSGKFLPSSKRLVSGIPVYGGNGEVWYTDTHLVDYPTIIIGRVGTYCGNINLVTEPVWITDNAIYIKELKKQCLDLNFLYYLMYFLNFNKYADYSGQPKITQDPLNNINYIIPPLEKQKLFSDFTKQVEYAKSSMQAQLQEAETLKAALMQQYFSQPSQEKICA